MVALRLGSCLSYIRSIKTLAEDMRAVRPTVLLGVPLMIEKLYAKAAAGVKKNPLARILLALRIKGPVRKKIIASLGGEMRLIGVGGAPCPIDVIKGFQRFGIKILEGYGLTEASPGVAFSDLDFYKAGTVGRVIPNSEAKLHNPDASGVGELWVRGPIVMKGYYKNPEATAEVITPDGWLKTGDLASMDEAQRITIRGRCKALIVNREGKNIYPEEIENAIAVSPFIQDVIVLGYNIKEETGERVGVIVTPNVEAINTRANAPLMQSAKAHLGQIKDKIISKAGEVAAKAVHRPVKETAAAKEVANAKAREQDAPATPEAIEELLRAEVLRLTAPLADYKHPRKIEVHHETLERTSTMKVRRVTYQGTLDEE